MIDKNYCKGCNFSDKRYPPRSTERLPYCIHVGAYLHQLKNCPMKSDDCFK